MKQRVAKQITLLNKQGLNCPQFSSFLDAYKISVIILNIKQNMQGYCDPVTGQ